jgi:hypothetical protein
VSERCIALRATWPSAAMMVKGIQSEATENMEATGWQGGHRAGREKRGQRETCMTGLRWRRQLSGYAAPGGYVSSATTI